MYCRILRRKRKTGGQSLYLQAAESIRNPLSGVTGKKILLHLGAIRPERLASKPYRQGILHGINEKMKQASFSAGERRKIFDSLINRVPVLAEI
ncbi:MAG TPA: hypothetical protein VK892_20935 [Pyrinomonadaceae bacterium]|nr:hypothetical protein [Pyrinomonadaceae bacterium]